MQKIALQKFALAKKGLKIKLILNPKTQNQKESLKFSMKQVQMKNNQNTGSSDFSGSSRNNFSRPDLGSGLTEKEEKLLKILEPVVDQSVKIILKSNGGSVLDVRESMSIVGLFTSILGGFKENKTIGQIHSLAESVRVSRNKTDGLFLLLQSCLKTKF